MILILVIDRQFTATIIYSCRYLLVIEDVQPPLGDVGRDTENQTLFEILIQH